MQHYYKMTIAGLERSLPICRVSDELYIGAFVIFGDAPLTVACARDLLAKAPEYDYLITAEAKGIPLAHEMAQQHEDAHYFIARKHPKLYMTGVFESDVRSITTDADQHLYLDVADAEMMKGKRILIVDDVISTGQSLAAIEALVNKGAVNGSWLALKRPSWRRATLKSGTTSSIWSLCPSSTPTAPSSRADPAGKY